MMRGDLAQMKGQIVFVVFPNVYSTCHVRLRGCCYVVRTYKKMGTWKLEALRVMYQCN